MEKNDEKDLRIYIKPETVVVEMSNEGVICQSELEPGQPGGPI